MEKFEIREFYQLTSRHKEEFKQGRGKGTVRKVMPGAKEYFYLYQGEVAARLWVVPRNFHGAKTLVIMRAYTDNTQAVAELKSLVPGRGKTPRDGVQEMFLHAMRDGIRRGCEFVEVAEHTKQVDQLLQWGKQQGFLQENRIVPSKIPRPIPNLRPLSPWGRRTPPTRDKPARRTARGKGRR